MLFVHCLFPPRTLYILLLFSLCFLCVFVLCQILDEWYFYFTHAYVYQITLTVVTLQSTNCTFVFTLSVAACYESVYHSIVYRGQFTCFEKKNFYRKILAFNSILKFILKMKIKKKNIEKTLKF